MSLPGKRLLETEAALAASPEPLTDEAVVERVLVGEVAVFELLMRRYNQRLFRVARSVLGDEAEAEDVVQEAYVRAFEHLRQFAGRSLFATWLTKIVVHEALVRRRKRRPLQLHEPVDAELESMVLPTHRSDAAEAASQNELGGLLASAVDALPVELRLVFTLRMVERLSTGETANCLGLTPANVKVRLHRARLQLRTWINARIGAESRQLYMFAGERCDRIVANVLSRIAQA